MVLEITKRAGPRKAEAKVTKGQAISHKAYSYTNKKGKTVTVKAHTEYPKGK